MTTVTGMLVATVAMLIANRLLPESLADKGAWERNVFWSTWALTMVHAFLRSGAVAQARMNPAWREQCWAIALGAASAVIANAVTTGDHLGKTLSAGYWPVAGADLSLIAMAAIALFAASKLAQGARRSASPEPASPSALKTAGVRRG